MTLDEFKKAEKGEIEVFVDTDTSRESVSRAVESVGWQVKEIREEEYGYRILINKD